MQRYFLPRYKLRTLCNARTGIKHDWERGECTDAPGRPKVKTTAEIPPGSLPEDFIDGLPDLAVALGRTICGNEDLCIMKAAIERGDGVTELYASCTGPCLDKPAQPNVPEATILAIDEGIESGLAAIILQAMK